MKYLWSLTICPTWLMLRHPLSQQHNLYRSAISCFWGVLGAWKYWARPESGPTNLSLWQPLTFPSETVLSSRDPAREKAMWPFLQGPRDLFALSQAQRESLLRLRSLHVSSKENQLSSMEFIRHLLTIRTVPKSVYILSHWISSSLYHNPVNWVISLSCRKGNKLKELE